MFMIIEDSNCVQSSVMRNLCHSINQLGLFKNLFQLSILSMVHTVCLLTNIFAKLDITECY